VLVFRKIDIRNFAQEILTLKTENVSVNFKNVRTRNRHLIKQDQSSAQVAGKELGAQK